MIDLKLGLCKPELGLLTFTPSMCYSSFPCLGHEDPENLKHPLSVTNTVLTHLVGMESCGLQISEPFRRTVFLMESPQLHKERFTRTRVLWRYYIQLVSHSSNVYRRSMPVRAF